MGFVVVVVTRPEGSCVTVGCTVSKISTAEVSICPRSFHVLLVIDAEH